MLGHYGLSFLVYAYRKWIRGKRNLCMSCAIMQVYFGHI